MRAFFIAVSAFCLVCIGVHAAADRVDDLIQAGVQRIDTVIDGIVSAWSFTRPLADWIDSALIVKVSRSLALVWELCTSLLLVASVFAYERRIAFESKTVLRDLRRAWLELRSRFRRDGPRMLATILRPVCTAAFVLAGSGAVARIVHGSIVVGTSGVLGPRAASLFGRLLGGAGLVSTLVILGLPALAASFVNAPKALPSRVADQGWVSRPGVGASEAGTTMEILFPRTWTREVAVLALTLPLAYFALQAGLHFGGMFT